jgi:hypothetical protein
MKAMKPTTSLPPARKFAGTNGSRPLRQTRRWTLVGSSEGTASGERVGGAMDFRPASQFSTRTHKPL